MNEAIAPQHLSLIELLDNRLFTIPDYQRSYSWSDRQRKDLFEDIEEVWRQDDQDSIHFMATVVCRRLSGNVRLGTKFMTKLDIVDGQQRLTTLILLLNAIRYALDEGDDEHDELARLLVKRHGDNLLLLQTNHDACHYFADYMRSGEAPEPHTAKTLADRELLDAITQCGSFVRDWPQGDRTLVDLAAIVKNQLTFILHEIRDERTVYTVFEVLNSRGMPVSRLDSFKSILMGLAFTLDDATRDELLADLRQVWRDIYSTLGLRQGLGTEALRFAATLYLKERPSKALGEQDAVESLRERATSASSIRKVAKWLLRVTKACDAVMSDVRQNAVTEVTQARLLAVALHTTNFGGARVRDNLLGTWARVSFLIYGLHDKDARTGVGDYVRLAWDVVNGATPKEVRTRLADIAKPYPVGEAIDNLRGADCYNETRGGTDHLQGPESLRYLLYRYEEHLAREQRQRVENVQWAHVWAKTAGLSIEHIRPQSDGQDHTLGNLMLLPPGLNAQLGANPPADKAERYRKTGFRHAAEVADMLEERPRWPQRAIQKRERKILDWVRKEWADD